MQLTALSNLKRGQAATVVEVADRHPEDAIARRLRELGFISGRRVHLRTMGPIARDPLLIQVGSTRFALRRSEADRVQVQLVD